MDSAGYISLSRQSGLMREIQVVANNISNVSTTGFKREGIVFAEHIARLDQEPSMSLTNGSARLVDLSPGGISRTGGSFDLAIQGEGFFLIMTPAGERLTRSGSFTPSAEGELLTNEGFPLLDMVGTPVFVPGDARISVGEDGTLSANGEPIGQVGLWLPEDRLYMRHGSGTTFDGGVLVPAENSKILQGFLEDSNVNPVSEITRMISVQRSYELGQSFLEAEDGRSRSVISTLGQ